MTAQREAAPLRHATVYEQMLVKLAADQRTLKAIYSKELKAAKKRELLPFWLPWVNGVLEQGKGAQDDILMTVMLWRLDTGDIAGALEIARYALKYGLTMPGKQGETVMPVMNTHQNIAAFLDMLAVSEGTANHPLTKNRGYDVIVTGLDGKPEIFTDYSDHPFAHGRPAKVFNRRGEKSTASGRYQQLYLFWPHYRKQLALPDFSPLSQDRLAIQLIRERGALDDIRAGRIERAISRCRSIWASLPGAGYGQREHSLEKLVTVWRTAGGVPA
ncbi:glycoside hydrolase family protein [Escherichia coli]|nr:glycoside hydrolase family protein [Escherichia coli]EFN4612061.1 glycoside hydrolase family protein [Escherichia coli]